MDTTQKVKNAKANRTAKFKPEPIKKSIDPKKKTQPKAKPFKANTLIGIKVEGVSVARRVDRHSMSEFCAKSAGDAFKIMYQMDPTLTLFGENKTKSQMKNARDWWEPTDPTTQCKNVIGLHDANTMCYICGLKLAEDEKQDNPPECEHILPVFHANLFLSLYSPREHLSESMKKKFTSELDWEKYKQATQKELRMEYDWAHRCCNQIKSDTGFMSYDETKREMSLDYNATRSILTRIFTGKGLSNDSLKYCNKISGKIQNYCNRNNITKEKWVKDRIDAIQAEKIMPICKYINKSLKESPGLYYLSVLSNLTAAADWMKMSAAQNAAGVFRLAPVEESLQKTSIYTTLSTRMTEAVDVIDRSSLYPPTLIESLIKRMFSNVIQAKPRILENGDIDNKKMQPYILELCVSHGIDESSTRSSQFTYSTFFKDVFSACTLINPPIVTDTEMTSQLCNIAQKAMILLCILDKQVFRGQFDGVMKDAKLSERQKSALLPPIQKYVNAFKNQFLIRELKKCIVEMNELIGDGEKSDKVVSVLSKLLENHNLDIREYVSGIPTVDVSTYINTSTLVQSRQEYMRKYGGPEMTESQIRKEITHLDITPADKLNTLIMYLQEPELPENVKQELVSNMQEAKLQVERDIQLEQEEEARYQKEIIESALILENLNARKKLSPEKIVRIVESVKKSPAKSPAIKLQTQMVDAANTLLTLAKAGTKSPSLDREQLERIRESLKRSLSRSTQGLSRSTQNRTKRMRLMSPARRAQ